MDSFVQNVFTIIGFGAELFFVETGVYIRRKAGEVECMILDIETVDEIRSRSVNDYLECIVKFQNGMEVGCREELVRCKDCKHGRLYAQNSVDCELQELAKDADWFCADGERKKDRSSEMSEFESCAGCWYAEHGNCSLGNEPCHEKKQDFSELTPMPPETESEIGMPLGFGSWWYRCPMCHDPLDYRQKECSWCHLKIDWEGR